MQNTLENSELFDDWQTVEKPSFNPWGEPSSGTDNRPEISDPCEECQECPSSWYCDKCHAGTCEECYQDRRPHKRDDPGHTKVPYAFHKHFRSILDPSWTEQKRESEHMRDVEALWFALNKTDGCANVQEFPRYGRLVSEHRTHHGSTNTYSPRLISFVGTTGAGKSTLVRMLLERPWLTRHTVTQGLPNNVPVVGKLNSTAPTSGDVHLYGSIQFDQNITRPLFYADCEGFDGGEVAPAGSLSPKTAGGFRPNSTERSTLDRFIQFLLRQVRNHALDLSSNSGDSQKPLREVAVTKLFPRLLYNFSDVVVFVISGSMARTLETVFVKLLDWAQTSGASAVNRTTLPHLVVALNGVDGEAAWDSKQATTKIFSEHQHAMEENPGIKEHKDRFQRRGIVIPDLESLLKRSYSSVEFIWIPNGRNSSSSSFLSSQLEKLHNIIDERSQEAHNDKAEAGMLLPSRQQELFFRYAFDHYSKSLDTPFNFMEVLLSLNPMPRNFGDHIFRFLQAVKEARGEEMQQGVPVFFLDAADVLSSALALDAARYYSHVPGKLTEFFQGNVLPQEGDSSSPRQATYDSHVRDAIGQLVDRCKCEFTNNDGQRCVNMRVSHDRVRHHQDECGDQIGNGDFESNFVDMLLGSWSGILVDRLDAVEAEIFSAARNSTDTFTRITCRAETHAAWSVHHRNIRQLYSSVPKLDTTKNKPTCFWCLRNVPSEVMPCGHAICVWCAKFSGSSSAQDDPRIISIESCALHPKRVRFDTPFIVQTRPEFAGIRILALDGGGVRGILELQILHGLQNQLGGKIPIARFFDLVTGTSTGALIAIGLGLKGWSVEQCKRKYKALCKNAFTPFSVFSVFSWWSYFYNGALYRTEPLESILREELGEDSMVSAKSKVPANAQANKVFVTATKDQGKKACIFTNYLRDGGDPEGDGESTYDFETLAAGGPFKVWEAARASCAGPSYFRGFSKNCSHEYWDGGLHNNNPAHLALRESQRIWPAVASEHPDLLFSISSGASRNGVKGDIDKINNSWGIFKIVRVAKRRFDLALDSDHIWLHNFGETGLELGNPDRYVRSHQVFDSALPKLDDKDALENGILCDLANIFAINQNGTIERVAKRLVATSFYFHPLWITEQDGDDTVKFEGHIGCRFFDGSDDLDAFHDILEPYGQLEFRMQQLNQVWTVDLEQRREMKAGGTWRLPKVEFAIPKHQNHFDIRLFALGFKEQSISGCPWPIRKGGDLTRQISLLSV